MKIAIASLARNNVEYKGHKLDQVNRYFCQLIKQSIFDIADIDFFIEEGDSQDNTYEELILWQSRLLKNYNINLNLLKYDTKTTEKIASVRSESRYKHLSHIGDVLLDYIVIQGNSYDYVFWVEFDLIIKNNNLIENLLKGFIDSNVDNVGIVAPMVKCLGTGKTDVHYDILGHRTLDGKGISPHHKFSAQQYVLMEGIGSCCLFRYELLKKNIRFSGGCFMHFCDETRKLGYNIVVDTSQTIFHPTYKSIQGRWC